MAGRAPQRSVVFRRSPGRWTAPISPDAPATARTVQAGVYPMHVVWSHRPH
jgi:hypothetical protein